VLAAGIRKIEGIRAGGKFIGVGDPISVVVVLSVRYSVGHVAKRVSSNVGYVRIEWILNIGRSWVQVTCLVLV
jgi:hypothetical protein